MTDRPALKTSYRLWVNTDRTVFVRLWPSGAVEVATRDHPDDTWGPPAMLWEEKGTGS